MVNKADLTAVFGILIDAKVHYRLWEELMIRRDQKNVDLVNSGYATFFEYTRKAHFKAFIVDLHKLVETRQDTYNLQRILDQYAETLTENDSELDEIEQYKNTVAEARKGIFILRNNLEAHHSSSKTIKEIFEAANLSSAELQSFIVKTGCLLNMINSKCFSEQRPLNQIGEEEAVNKLFEAMQAYEST